VCECECGGVPDIGSDEGSGPSLCSLARFTWFGVTSNELVCRALHHSDRELCRQDLLQWSSFALLMASFILLHALQASNEVCCILVNVFV
jgi:hypothetical protein